MKKIFVKIPKEKGKKWSLQMKGAKAKRFISAANIFNRLERVFPRREFKEKTAIVVKEYIDSHFEKINETLPSKDTVYLLYATVCFLEDYIPEGTLLKKCKKYQDYSEDY